MTARALWAWVPFFLAVVAVGALIRPILVDRPPVIVLGALLLLGTVVRYLLLAGGAWWVYYGPGRGWVGAPRIQSTWPDARQVRRELGWALSTMVIFAAAAFWVFVAVEAGHTAMIREAPDGIDFPRTLGTVVLMLVLHDLYFYVLHRFLHWGPLFRHIHRVHHRSTNPTPLAAFAFHPVEAVLEAAILPLLAFMIPWRPLDLALFAVATLSLNVLGHLGFEVFGPSWARHPVLGWLNTSTHHNLHHQLVRGHYGLYSNAWDRLFGSQRPDYVSLYESVHVTDGREHGLHRSVSSDTMPG
ncbi:MAG: sterol desaturase family protein [Candidatus Sericytochromatia bacterium]|nr:sterol desaturase family protein [Candidatus Sericytochromatia bacterium]